jgi:chemotaxis protein CheX
MREKIISALCESTLEVFSTMVPMDIKQGEIYDETTSSPCSDGVVSVVGFSGEWVGTGSIACSADFACKVAAALLMSEMSGINDEVLDAVGEVANMIVGSFKTRMEEHLGPMGLSIPTVIYGRNFTARSLNQAEWIVAPFDCEGSRFDVKVCMAPHGAGGRQPVNNAVSLVA